MKININEKYFEYDKKMTKAVDRVADLVIFDIILGMGVVDGALITHDLGAFPLVMGVSLGATVLTYASAYYYRNKQKECVTVELESDDYIDEPDEYTK